MAAHMPISSRFPSWRDYHLSKKKERKELAGKTDENGGLIARAPFSTFSNDPFSFMKAVDFFEGDSFLLLPAGGNRVSVVHNCFKVDVKDGSGLSVFGILGSRISSPFKRVDVNQATRHQTAPKVTRSEERKEEWAPSAENLSKCKSADEFKDLLAKPGDKRYSADELWKYPHCCFAGYPVFEAFGEDCTKRAGDLAMEILRLHHEKARTEPEGEDERAKVPEKEFKILLFLWAIENSWMKKVPLYDAPDNQIFDRLAQEVWQRLDKKEEPRSLRKEESVAPRQPRSLPTRSRRFGHQQQQKTTP